jgi:hypothetical protein
VAAVRGEQRSRGAARRRGYEVVHPLTTEPLGIRRFLIHAPDGTVLNIAQHSDP